MDTQHYHSGHIRTEYPLNAQEKLRDIRTYSVNAVMLPNVGKEICNIMNKLHVLFSRYEGQKEDLAVNIPVPTID